MYQSEDEQDDIRIQTTVPMPTIMNGKGKNLVDASALYKILDEENVERVIIEKVGAMPGQGVTSMFSFGYGCGVIEGVVACLRVPYEFVTPQAWMKVVLAGMTKGEYKASPLYCQRRFPNQNWMATARSKKMHDGMTDSACIAMYLLTKLKTQ